MYERFYGLKEKPFSIQPDPEFLYFSKRHEMAFTMLQYGIENRAGFSVITGEIGCGKTTLIRHLLHNLEDTVRVGLISNTHQDIADLLEWILLAFEQPFEHVSKVAMHDVFQKYLIKEYAEGRRVVLIIDEAQNLNPKALEALRMLSNINADKHQLLQMILVGQPQLKALLRSPDLHQFAQRVSVDFHIEPLTKAEVVNYIEHRLKVAGMKGAFSLFSHGASRLIADASEGIPRRINILCDTALVYAFASGAPMVDMRTVKKVIADKQNYGVFDAKPMDPPVEDRREPPVQPGEPALVIYDKALAEKMLNKMYDKEEETD
jgi:general secretion pathway protein A